MAGIALGGTLYSYQIHTDGDGEKYQTDTTTLSLEESKTIRGIDWNIRTSDIKVVNGDNYSVTGSGRYRSYIKDGIWHIKTEKKVARITFLDHSIEIPNFFNDHNWEDKDEITKNTITIPVDTSLESANIHVTAGALTGENLYADHFTLKTDAGSCTLEQISAKKLSVKVGAGSSTLRKIQVSDSCTAKVGAGELILGSKKIPSGVNSISNLRGKCAAGNMTVTGKLTGTSRLQCSIGDIDVLLDGYRHNYNLNSHGSLGEIDIKDNDSYDFLDDMDDDWDDDDYDYDDYDGNYNKHHDNHQSSYTPIPSISVDKEHPSATPINKTENEDETRYGNLSLKCSLGDITVKFQH